MTSMASVHQWSHWPNLFHMDSLATNGLIGVIDLT